MRSSGPVPHDLGDVVDGEDLGRDRLAVPVGRAGAGVDGGDEGHGGPFDSGREQRSRGGELVGAADKEHRDRRSAAAEGDAEVAPLWIAVDRRRIGAPRVSEVVHARRRRGRSRSSPPRAGATRGRACARAAAAPWRAAASQCPPPVASPAANTPGAPVWPSGRCARRRGRGRCRPARRGQGRRRCPRGRGRSPAGGRRSGSGARRGRRRSPRRRSRRGRRRRPRCGAGRRTRSRRRGRPPRPAARRRPRRSWSARRPWSRRPRPPGR